MNGLNLPLMTFLERMRHLENSFIDVSEINKYMYVYICTYTFTVHLLYVCERVCVCPFQQITVEEN